MKTGFLLIIICLSAQKSNFVPHTFSRQTGYEQNFQNTGN